jgi:hypothetical protein
MAEEAQQFLAAEEAVQELLTNLKALKSEIDHYSEAKSSLADTRDSVVNLAAKLSELTGRAAGIIETIGQVGAPEILARLESMRLSIEAEGGSMRSLEAETETLRGSIAGILEHVTATSAEQEARIRSQFRKLLVVFVLAFLFAAGAFVLCIPAVQAMLGG